jgi:hypothetical protein
MTFTIRRHLAMIRMEKGGQKLAISYLPAGRDTTLRINRRGFKEGEKIFNN